MKVIRQNVYYMEDRLVKESQAFMTSDKREAAKKRTMSHQILSEKKKFDALAFRVEADQDLFATAHALHLPAGRNFLFYHSAAALARAAAERFGGELVPVSFSDPTCYLMEQAKGGDLFMTSFPSGVGGVGALTLLGDAEDLLRAMEGGTVPDVRPFAVFVRGKLPRGTGPVDVALALKLALGGRAKGKVLEFFGAAEHLSAEFRTRISELVAPDAAGIVWQSQGVAPVQPAYYEGGISLDLSKIEPMVSRDGNISTLAAVSEEGFCGGAAKVGYESAAEASELVRGKRVRLPVTLVPASRTALLQISQLLPTLLEAGIAVEPCEEAGDLMDPLTLCSSALHGAYFPATGETYVRRLKKPAKERATSCEVVRIEGNEDAPFPMPSAPSSSAEFRAESD